MSFETFWKAYPRKVAKGYCRQIYRDITTDGKWVVRKDTGEKWFVQGTEEQLNAGAEAFARKVARDGTEERHIPHPSTWMHEGRFEDEYEEPDELPLTDRQKLVALLANDQWKKSWGPRPSREEAKARLDALGNGHYERMRLVR